jgi:hypothetical protein
VSWRTAVVVASTSMATTISAAVGVSPASPEPHAAAPARLLVSASEFRFTLSRSRIQRGRAIVQLLNRGEDDHDLRLRRISRNGNPVARWAITRPGDLSQLSLRLSPGRYRLWCSLPGHRAAGMSTALRVSPGG